METVFLWIAIGMLCLCLELLVERALGGEFWFH